MPIRREHQFFYPIDWRELSRGIRFRRAGGACEGCGRPHGRAVVVQRKTGRPVQFELLEPTRTSILTWLTCRSDALGDYVFPSRIDGHRSAVPLGSLVSRTVFGEARLRDVPAMIRDGHAIEVSGERVQGPAHLGSAQRAAVPGDDQFGLQRGERPN